MSLRKRAERIRQTLYFEAGGLLLVVPAYTFATGESTADSTVLMVLVSIAILVWTPIHNHLFDLAELHWAQRVASDRPQRLRGVHALSQEITAIAISLPILIWVGDMDLGAAIVVDLSLTLFYIVYTYVFHIVFDRFHPVEPYSTATKESAK